MGAGLAMYEASLNFEVKDHPLMTGITYEFDDHNPISRMLLARIKKLQQGISIFSRRKIRILKGKLFFKIKNIKIGLADVISDVGGVFTYTENLGEDLDKILNLLKIGIGEYRLVYETNRVVEIRNERNNLVDMRTFFTQIRGVEVVEYQVVTLPEPSNEGFSLTQVILLRTGKIEVPQLTLLKRSKNPGKHYSKQIYRLGGT